MSCSICELMKSEKSWIPMEISIVGTGAVFQKPPLHHRKIKLILCLSIAINCKRFLWSHTTLPHVFNSWISKVKLNKKSFSEKGSLQFCDVCRFSNSQSHCIGKGFFLRCLDSRSFAIHTSNDYSGSYRQLPLQSRIFPFIEMRHFIFQWFLFGRM